ncbi:hypothetical protein CAPTEDRAFT_179012 [Capitella teleta]|uniref:FERM, ARHGEF and pleckstrin domain-containing protein 1 n=1 Tax=Capitella teleta TaxID=283909 RepID=R7V6C4_CAPTE|nr:hypothetical protein CAPTEDRAFT_179012 [Capitella teleta]|eukprot:ELU11305.1 hypothetical protein CAPTEDRAFT_179012 [Capitella teleta]
MSVHDLHFLFLVKFYTPDPGLLEEEYTRYLFALQVKRDLATGAMPCQEHTAVLLASYIAQAEIGDFLEDEYIDHAYLSQLRLLPNQTEDLDIKIREHHREHIGQTPAEADFNLLDTARKVELYGIRLHPAKDHEGVALHLAVAHMGVLVFQSYTKINTFSWAKVRKLSFKRKKFLIKLHPEGYGYYKDTVEFYFDSRNESKNFWKKCIEHHAFFRCHSVKKLPRNKTRVVSRGSSFRYSGRTQKQLVEYVRENFVKRPHFESAHREEHADVVEALRAEASANPYRIPRKASEDFPGPPDFDVSSEESDSDVFRPGLGDFDDAGSILASHAESQPYSPDSHYGNGAVVQHMVIREDDESLPPPPPPIYDDRSPTDERDHREATMMSKSSASQASATLTSNASVTSSTEEEGRRKRHPADKAYYIAKELLMTERTYKKDLEVIVAWFRDMVGQTDCMPEHLGDLLFSSVDPIYDAHSLFLQEVEQRLALWEGKSNAHLNGEYKRIGDIMLSSTPVLQLYHIYLQQHEEILSEIEVDTLRNKGFEAALHDFEAQKVCYLPFNTFLLKPAQRLLHYKLILERLLNHYGAAHADYRDCQIALSKILDVIEPFKERMVHLENLQKLLELQRDLVGIDNLVQPQRRFIREGCLQKLSRKGYQQRMFFLFSDMLVYSSRTATPSLQFKVHGQLPLRGMVIDESDPKMAVPNGFTVYGGNRCLLVSATSPEERSKWMEDLTAAVQLARQLPDDGQPKVLYPSLKSNSSSECLDESCETPQSPSSPDRQIQHRANTTMHVCWHRNTSVSMRDHAVAVENQLSGYLLRKFKNSNGWQKLWVVFTNFCLFFYKTFQDDYPLASLPLLGYAVSAPAESDGIQKDYVFKLQFKNHVYFFRAESEYTFERWIEVVKSATSAARRTRMFSRLESSSTGGP